MQDWTKKNLSTGIQYNMMMIVFVGDGINKYSSTSYLNIAHILKGFLFIRYKTDSEKNKTDGIKSLRLVPFSILMLHLLQKFH